MTGEYVRDGGGLQWCCQQRLDGKGQWGQPTLAWALARAHTTRRVRIQQLLETAQHRYMHTGQSSNGMEKERTAADPEDLSPEASGAPACKALVFLVGDG